MLHLLNYSFFKEMDQYNLTKAGKVNIGYCFPGLLIVYAVEICFLLFLQ